MYGVALGRLHPESQGRHLSFEVTGRERDKWDKGYRYRWRSNWGERLRRGGGRSRVVVIVSSSEGKERTYIYSAEPLTPLGDVNVWKQNREEGGQLKPLTIKGWGIVILDLRMFH